MFERHRADGLEVALEHGIRDRHLDPVAGKCREAFANRVGASSNYREVDEADSATTLVREHPHQVCVPHRIERMVLEWTFVERHGADE